MKKITYIVAGVVALLICVVIAVSVKHLYPVALVDGSPIWYSTWNRYLSGMGHALDVEAKSTGQKFAPTTAVAQELRRGTLTTLIENKILERSASVLLPNLDDLSEQKVASVLSTSDHLGDATQFIYGFDAKDFHDFILLPISKREVIQSEFDAKKISFDAWLAGAKKKARVRVLIGEYYWDGDKVK